VPVEIEESALVDGASRLRVLRSITLPLSVPGLIATGVFTFIFSWNEFLFALVLNPNQCYHHAGGLERLLWRAVGFLG
jgi:ABC-type glycerol-3-phosphate transport system permease component